MQTETINTGSSTSVGHLGQVSVRIVKIMDGAKSEVVNFSAFRTDRLEEWWLTPSQSFTWCERDITRVGCRDLNHLAAKLTRDEDFQARLMDIQSHISGAAVPYRTTSELSWSVGTRLVDGVGPVLSIICGDTRAFNSFIQMKRERAPAQAST